MEEKMNFSVPGTILLVLAFVILVGIVRTAFVNSVFSDCQPKVDQGKLKRSYLAWGAVVAALTVIGLILR